MVMLLETRKARRGEAPGLGALANVLRGRNLPEIATVSGAARVPGTRR
jgi:hypothetical protein